MAKKRRSIATEEKHGLKVSYQAEERILEGDMLQAVQNCYRNGWDDATVAAMLGITRRSWLRVLAREPELRTLVDDARAFTLGVAQQKLFELVNKGNVTAIIWFQKNKDSENWKDRRDVTVEGTQRIEQNVVYRATFDNGDPVTADPVPVPETAH